LFNRLSISPADIPCVLENVVGETARSIEPGTLYVTVNIKPPSPTLHNSPVSPPSIPTADDGSPAEEARILTRTQTPSLEHPLLLSDQQTVDAGNNEPQSREVASPASIKDLRLAQALDEADEAINRVVPTDRSNTWEGAVAKMKWVMDTLGPIAGVSVMPF
jgi:hypothetical protein